jgi:hypothetical protein
MHSAWRCHQTATGPLPRHRVRLMVSRKPKSSDVSPRPASLASHHAMQCGQSIFIGAEMQIQTKAPDLRPAAAAAAASRAAAAPPPPAWRPAPLPPPAAPLPASVPLPAPPLLRRQPPRRCRCRRLLLLETPRLHEGSSLSTSWLRHSTTATAASTDAVQNSHPCLACTDCRRRKTHSQQAV